MLRKLFGNNSQSPEEVKVKCISLTNTFSSMYTSHFKQLPEINKSIAILSEMLLVGGKSTLKIRRNQEVHGAVLKSFMFNIGRIMKEDNISTSTYRNSLNLVTLLRRLQLII